MNVDMEVSRANDPSARLAQADFFSKSVPLETFPDPWAARQ